MKKTRPKKQHYISKHYLRNFCTKNEKFYVYNKKEDRTYWADLEDVAEENYFFNLGISDVYKNATEEEKIAIDEACVKDGFKPYKDLSEEERINLEHVVDDLYSDKYEPQFRDMIALVNKRIVEHETVLLNKNEKEEFAYLFSLHYIRTKYVRDKYNDIRISLLKQMTAIYAQFQGEHIDSDKINITYSKEQQRLFHISSIIDEELIDRIAFIFSQYTWQFILFDKGTLLLPDHFANLCPTEEILPMYPPSITSYGMVIEIPLSKRLILVMMDSRKFKDFKDCELTPFNILSNVAIKSSNRNSVVCCHNYVFSCDEKALKLAIADYKKELMKKSK